MSKYLKAIEAVLSNEVQLRITYLFDYSILSIPSKGKSP